MGRCIRSRWPKPRRVELMNAHDYLSDDGQALLPLCSAFGLPDNAAAKGFVPLKLTEWNQLAKKIAACSFKHPAALQGSGR